MARARAQAARTRAKAKEAKARPRGKVMWLYDGATRYRIGTTRSFVPGCHEDQCCGHGFPGSHAHAGWRDNSPPKLARIQASVPAREEPRRASE
mmetsp:Transcript_118485/g.330558  ORF Transcript_118485/g.330558 Transcript_118485/m.330558 type:complete len:94 (+) Transcript_118485:1013-1294(+)